MKINPLVLTLIAIVLLVGSIVLLFTGYKSIAYPLLIVGLILNITSRILDKKMKNKSN